MSSMFRGIVCAECGEDETFFEIDGKPHCASCGEPVAASDASADPATATSSADPLPKTRDRVNTSRDFSNEKGAWVERDGTVCPSCGETEDFFELAGKQFCGCCAEQLPRLRFAVTVTDNEKKEIEKQVVRDALKAKADKAAAELASNASAPKRRMSVSKKKLLHRRHKRTPSAAWLQLGSEVQVHHGQYKGKTAVVRYVGPVEFSRGLWIGCEVAAGEGRSDGKVQGIRYFQCAEKAALFFKPYTLQPGDARKKDDSYDDDPAGATAAAAAAGDSTA